MTSQRTLALALPCLIGFTLLPSTAVPQTVQSATPIAILTPDQREFLSHVTMVDLPDGLGGFARTARISGINVQVVNGSGTTDGAVDGLGNLIVGYDELRGAGNDRTGSHNLIVGIEQNYNSYGGLLTGRRNTLSAAYASVSGGFGNTAGGLYSSVSGGSSSIASGMLSSIRGGHANTASGTQSSVGGGSFNTASGGYSSVGGGFGRLATGPDDWVAGSLFEDL